MVATPVGNHAELAAEMLTAGSHVVSISDDPDEVGALLDLDQLARDNDRALVVGAGFCPGLSCVLARYAADQLDQVDAINVSRAGTAGPACARQHHHALKSDGRDWRDGTWVLRRGGSGRDLAWFPDPIGARDCYRGALPTPLLLQREYPDAMRISARMAATRRDRLTGRLPMLRRPHRDGGPGAIRVEVRGRGRHRDRDPGIRGHGSPVGGRGHRRCGGRHQNRPGRRPGRGERTRGTGPTPPSSSVS